MIISFDVHLRRSNASSDAIIWDILLSIER